MLNFISATPKILKETVETKFQEVKTQETNNADPLFVPENIKSLRNRYLSFIVKMYNQNFL